MPWRLATAIGYFAPHPASPLRCCSRAVLRITRSGCCPKDGYARKLFCSFLHHLHFHHLTFLAYFFPPPSSPSHLIGQIIYSTHSTHSIHFPPFLTIFFIACFTLKLYHIWYR
ncbi:hypothetical protein FB451DRAFT_1248595, partial [Mycena latifolia]